MSTSSKPSDIVSFKGPVSSLLTGQVGDDTSAATVFLSRFGLMRTMERNKDLVEVIKDPQARIALVNKNLLDLGAALAEEYTKTYQGYIRKGFSTGESEMKTDAVMQLRLELALIDLRDQFPATFGGAGGLDPYKLLVGETEKSRQFQKGISAIEALSST